VVLNPYSVLAISWPARPSRSCLCDPGPRGSDYISMILASVAMILAFPTHVNFRFFPVLQPLINASLLLRPVVPNRCRLSKLPCFPFSQLTVVPTWHHPWSRLLQGPGCLPASLHLSPPRTTNGVCRTFGGDFFSSRTWRDSGLVLIHVDRYRGIVTLYLHVF
jgi:hypothetical protein